MHGTAGAEHASNALRWCSSEVDSGNGAQITNSTGICPCKACSLQQFHLVVHTVGIVSRWLDIKVNDTWKEHISVSSTLIIAPALSNSPQ